MKRFLFLMGLLCFFTVTSVMAQGKSDGAMRDFPVSDFKKISIEGNFKVFLYQSDQPYLKVLAPSDDMYDALDIRSGDGSLVISVKKRNFNLTRMELHAGFRDLEELRVEGGMKLTTDGYLEVKDFKIYIEGGANAEIKLKAVSIDVISKGGAIFDMEGITDLLSVKVEGAGHVNARDLTAREVVFRVGGVGFGSVYATDLLDVKIEGVGKVTYKGKPEVKRIIEGLGSVEEY